MKKRLLSILLCFCMALGLLPTTVFAQSSATDMSEMNALEALGIDTSVAPDGYDANDTSNPYGKDVTTLNPVSELLLMTEAMGYSGTRLVFDINATLNGHADGSLSTYSDFMSDSYSKSNSVAKSHEFQRYESTAEGSLVSDNYLFNVSGGFLGTATAAGNFDGNTEGLEKQYALLSVKRESSYFTPYGSFELQVLDAYDGKDTSVASAKTLIDAALFEYDFGNEEDRSAYTYQLQNYLQIAAGDFDGNGIDEIAVYIPSKSDPRIEVYQYQKKSGAGANAYQNVNGNWNLVWSYSIAKLGTSKNYIPNMVSLTAGDINEDGIEDLAITYSYFYGENNYDSGRAAVLFGGSKNMLQEYYDFPLVSTDGDEIVRAAFTYGEITGVGTNTLVLGGQSLTDLKKGNIYSRYVALYQFNGSGFDIVTDRNFDLFSKDNKGNYTYSVMKRTGEDKDKFYSSPLAVANLAVVSNGLSEAATLYFDSLYFTYSESGLELTAALDNTANYQHPITYKENPNDSNSKDITVNYRWYTEYGAASADIFGLGYDALGAMQHFIPIGNAIKNSLTGYIKDIYSNVSKLPADGWGVTGETYFVMAYTEAAVTDDNSSSYTTSSAVTSKKVNASSSFAFPNTDHDTAYLKYADNHYYTYSNPEVLAVLASAPYFSDLLDRDDLSGNYAESTTSYGTTKGSGDGVTANASLFAGAYASFEQDIKVFGITIASIEASETITASFTYEFEKLSTLEQTIEYSTSVGSDAVVLYSIPVVVYVYEAYTPNGNGGYDVQYMTVTSPHTAVTQVMELDKYEEIAKDYSELPQISGNILTHTLGDPTTYPTSAKGYKNALVYDGDYSAVGYSGTGGGATVTQSISMTKEESHSFSGSMAIEVSAGVGAGGIVVGVTAGSEAGAGYVMTSTSGSTYTASMQNMPAEAEEYGYALSWKLFAYEKEYYVGKKKKSVPVVNYLVTNVEMPPTLPEDFAQDVENTTDDTVALTWSYDKYVAGFQIYRYYEFPDGTGSYELAFVPFKNGVKQADGTWQFSYKDKNLSPYTDYYYQIQTVRSTVPNNSITSEVLTAKTRTDVGYPELTLNGLNDDGTLSIYPDSTNTVTVTVGNKGDYPQGISYQWQKLVDGNWTDVKGKNSPAYTFLSSGYSTAGTYRCRVNVIYWDADRGEEYLISAYSDTFEAVYRMHTVEVAKELSANVDENGYPYASVSIETTTSNHNVAPSGTVTFEISSYNYSRSYNVTLTAKGKTATANLTADITSKLPDGVYDITATYNGSRVFLPAELGSVAVLSGESGYRLQVYDKDGNETDSVVYGDPWSYKLIKYTKSENGEVSQTVATEFGSKQHAESPYWLGMFGQNGEARLAIQNPGGTYSYCGWGLYYVYDYSEKKNNIDYSDGYAFYAETPVGKYRLILEEKYGNNYEGRHTTYFYVTPRPITVGVTGNLSATYGEAENNQPELYVKEGSLAYDDKLSAELEGHTDFVSLHAYNTGGREVALNNSTLPGSYTVTGKVNPNNTVLIDGVNTRGDTVICKDGNEFKYYLVAASDRGAFITYDRNYDVTFEPATYIVTGQQYAVTAEVGTVNGKTAGTIELISPKSASESTLESGITFAGGTSLTFLAKPYAGYRVKSWTVTRGDTEPTKENGANLTLSCTMLSEPLHVAVEFEIEKYRLTVTNNTPSGGDITMPKGFANGAVTTPGAEWSFTAVPKSGYTFSHWEYVIGGSTTRYTTPTVTVTMPKSNAYLYPIFVRDSYTITLGDNLRVGYAWDHDNNSSTPNITRYVTSGAKITGDTVVTVEAAPGYEIPDNATWKLNGIPFSNDKKTFSFTILNDADVKVETVLGKYDLNVSTANGFVTAAYGDETVTVSSEDGSATINDIDGATDISLTATPDYGYVFSHWVVNGQTVDGSETVYNILKLSADTTVEAIFAQNTTHTVSGTFVESEGSLSYKVLDKYGNEQATGAYTSGTDITVYDGDTVELTATPRDSWMVGKWTVDGTVYDEDHSKTKTFEAVTDDITFEIDFVAQSYYTVYFSVVGANGHGKISKAYVNGSPFSSGKTDVGGGSTITLLADPDLNYMVKEWRINGKVVTKENGTVNQYNLLTIDSLSGEDTTVSITVEFQRIVTYDVRMNTDEAYTITWDNKNEARRHNGKVMQGEELIFTVKANAGYRLLGMRILGRSLYKITDNEDGSKTCMVYALTDNLLVGADSRKLYSITCGAAPNGTLSVAPNIAIAGETVTVTATPNTGYKRKSLIAEYSDGTATNELTLSDALTFVMPEADVEVMAVFIDENIYTVTFNANGGTLSQTSADTGTNGKLTALPTPIRDKFDFVGWFTEQSGGKEISTDTVFDKDTTVYAHWTEITYTVTFNANGGVLSQTTAKTDIYGKLTALPTPTRDGYSFVGWFTEQNGETEVSTDTVFDEDITVYAKWACAGHKDESPEDHKCDICGDVVSVCSGGTAGCTRKAVCKVCGQEYGEADTNNHSALKHVEAKAATTESEGNTEYWYCEDCNKYFADGECKTEITLADTITAKLENTDKSENPDKSENTDKTENPDKNESSDKTENTDKSENSSNAENADEAEGDNKAETLDKSDTAGNEAKSEYPQTGDNSKAIIWFAILLSSICLLALTGIYGKKKKYFVK